MTNAQLTALLEANITDNTTGANTAAGLRQVIQALIDELTPTLIFTMSQTGTDAPAITERVNTTGITYSFIRASTGVYVLNDTSINARTYISGIAHNNSGVVTHAITDLSGNIVGYYGIYINPTANRIYMNVLDTDMTTPIDLGNVIGPGEVFCFPEIKFFS